MFLSLHAAFCYHEPFLSSELYMSSKNALLQKLLGFLDDAKATDVVSIYVAEHTTVTDYMIIASGRSSRHAKAIAEQVKDNMKTAGMPALSVTGLEAGEWVLIDFGDFIVHVMQPDTRHFYNIEGLWQEANQAE